MMNNPFQILQRIQQFSQSYRGNPQQQIQQMLNSGQITQNQYNSAVQQATRIAKMLGLPTP